MHSKQRAMLVYALCHTVTTSTGLRAFGCGLCAHIDSTLTKDWKCAYQLIVTSRLILITARPQEPPPFFRCQRHFILLWYTLSTVVLCINAVPCLDRPRVSN